MKVLAFGIFSLFFIRISKKLVDENLGEVDVVNSDVDFGESLINFEVLHPFSFYCHGHSQNYRR